MNDYGTILESGAIRFQRLLPGPVDLVWSYLTDPDKRGRWLAHGAVDPRVGGRVDLHFRHADLSPQPDEVPEKYRQYENGANFTGRVTRCEPPHLLSHTWPEGNGRESEVTFELTPHGEHVLLVVTHRRIGAADMISVAGGWHTHLDILVDRLNGRVPRPFWSIHADLEREYERRIAVG